VPRKRQVPSSADVLFSTVDALVAAPGRVVASMPVVGIRRGLRMALAAHAGPCTPRVPAPVDLQAPAAVRPSALRALGLAPVPVLVRLGLEQVARVV